jgi:hypothetical protein
MSNLALNYSKHNQKEFMVLNQGLFGVEESKKLDVENFGS